MFRRIVLVLIWIGLTSFIGAQDSRCNLRPDSGRSCERETDRYYYNAREDRCRLFRYEGCGGNSNNFGSEEECERACGKNSGSGSGESGSQESRCNLRPDSGRSCERETYRYYYNAREDRCRLFRYEGCGGNSNNFGSQEECERACGKNSGSGSGESGSQESRCNLRPDSGRACDRETYRYYYNAEEDRCRLFRYEGCGGNSNNFGSEEECERACGKNSGSGSGESGSQESRCNLRPDSGRSCERETYRYYYNAREDRCRLFRYEGCGGNSNNFGSQEECERACGKDSSSGSGDSDES